MSVTGRVLAAIIVLASGHAVAEDRARVVIADGDPELARAIERALLPWQFEVVIEPIAMTETAAATYDARFVVWREGDQLVVFDRQTNLAERREARSGRFDPVEAAAAALTVKTMMRLPPPPAEPPVDEVPVEPLVDEPGPSVRFQAGVVGRLARGSQTDLGVRTALAIMVRPARWGLRVGVAGELGTAADVSGGAGFKGDWTDWSVAGLASWTFDLDPVALEPFAGAGIARIAFDGSDQQAPRSERATVPLVRAGVMVRWQARMWSVGAMTSVDALLDSPTYMRASPGMGSTQVLFEVPSVAVVVGVVAAIELGR